MANTEASGEFVGQVYGQYGSGTNFLDSLLRQNLPDLRMLPEIDDENTELSFGWKHADVGTEPLAYDENQHLRPASVLPLEYENSADVILFVLTRNPLDWIRAFHGKPHNAPALWGVELDEFVRTRWESFALQKGNEEFTREAAQRLLPSVPYSEKVEDFPTPGHLRAARNETFASFCFRFQNVVYLNYEPLAQNEAAQAAHIKAIAEVYGLKPTEEFRPVNGYKGTNKLHVRNSYPPIPHPTLRYLMSTIDWGLEEELGYRLASDAAERLRQPHTIEHPEGLVEPAGPSLRCYRLGQLCVPRMIEPVVSV